MGRDALPKYNRWTPDIKQTPHSYIDHILWEYGLLKTLYLIVFYGLLRYFTRIPYWYRGNSWLGPLDKPTLGSRAVALLLHMHKAISLAWQRSKDSGL